MYTEALNTYSIIVKNKQYAQSGAQHADLTRTLARALTHPLTLTLTLLLPLSRPAARQHG